MLYSNSDISRSHMKKNLLILCCVLTSAVTWSQSLFVNDKAADNIVFGEAGKLSIYVDDADLPLVKRAALLLQSDIQMVTGTKPVITNQQPTTKQAIIIGSITNSSLIVKLAASKKISTKNIEGKWEAYQLQSIAKPFAGVANALIIAGNDRRGTAFGVFDVSQQIGVSPWYWWADVPVKKKQTLYLKTNTIKTDAPSVKYRGIFINDEAPALSNWSKMTFGGFNHNFYEKVFELILRLKGNYLWPAMWGNAFYDDDSLNIKSADEYGIVIGTSHHEPLMRAHDEWRRYGKGKWNYDSNEVRLKEFWRGGMARGTNEKIVSIGMRGDGDEPMSRQTATALLERIVKDQRAIIEQVTKKPASETPQLWALYKEVQDYYDKGMRVPDDVTLLLCDDNWGNIRKLPKLDEKPRKGGYGIYYHFDYVGGPRNYKWLNTNPIARVWEQMHLAWEYNARQIWIVNVGDIKPMEFPISFFLDYAWNPDRISADDLQRYTEKWSAAQFGEKYAKEIADIISKYSKFNGRRKPELIDANSFSLTNYNELNNLTKEYFDLYIQTEKINNQLPEEYRDAFFQLVLHPVKACSNLYNLYNNVAWNRNEAKRNFIKANQYADWARSAYKQDSMISLEYHQLKNGKWNHMMSQTHIGYTYWQQPPFNRMPEVKYLKEDSAILAELEKVYVDTTKTAEALVPKSQTSNRFFEKNGYASIEADHFTKVVNANGITWKVLPDHGRTGSAVTTYPVTSSSVTVSKTSPHVQYELYTYDSGNVRINTYFSPTLNFHNTETGLQYAISIDDEEPQIISINKEDNNVGIWNGWVGNNIIIKSSTHSITRSGKHIVKYWMISPAVAMQKIVLDFGGLKPSYLGPPETKAK